jgi:hypothetical protein
MMRLITLALAVMAVSGFVPASQQVVKTTQSVAVADRSFTPSPLSAVLERVEMPEKLYIPKQKEDRT